MPGPSQEPHPSPSRGNNSEGLATRAASEYGHAGNLVEMIKENLIAERIAVDHYRELVRYMQEFRFGRFLQREAVVSPLSWDPLFALMPPLPATLRNIQVAGRCRPLPKAHPLL
jgi:hypothetical protein